MARENIGAPEAFDILRRASQRTNRKLKDVAADLIARQAKSGGQS
jgi:AmiR/NasT family two-component response regulator